MKPKRFPVQALLLVCALFVACSEQPAPGVERIFIGGAIYTLDESQPWAERPGGRRFHILNLKHALNRLLQKLPF